MFPFSCCCKNDNEIIFCFTRHTLYCFKARTVYDVLDVGLDSAVPGTK